ncbi:MAG: sulfite exporter TauE/SafE family protein [Oscillospiraceae bacterium]|nr:sulfite exporter TauE/SafE family protein [Oscillospiraceae bacterium]
MLDTLPVALFAGIVLGFLSGIGVGGGSLLMLWLTLVLEMKHSDARIINLLFFIPTAVISSVFRWKQKALDMKKILPAIICGCISAAIFSIISKQTDISLLKKLFGILLLIIGIKELLYRPRKAK